MAEELQQGDIIEELSNRLKEPQLLEDNKRRILSEFLTSVQEHRQKLIHFLETNNERNRVTTALKENENKLSSAGHNRPDFIAALESDRNQLLFRSTEINNQWRSILTNSFFMEFIESKSRCLTVGRMSFNSLKSELEEWNNAQKLAQIGPRFDQHICYDYLEHLDNLFGEMKMQLLNLISDGSAIVESARMIGDQTFFQNIQRIQEQYFALFYEVANEAVGISRQPPNHLTPGHETKEASNKFMRHPCVPRIRVLGENENFRFLHQKAKVKCKLVTEAEALKLKQNDDYVPREVGLLNPNETQFVTMPKSGSFQAVFDQIHLVKFKDSEPKLQKAPRPYKRYYIIFEIKLVTNYRGIKHEIKKNLISLPLSVFVTNTQRFEKGGDAALWWQLSFCPGNDVLSMSREPEKVIPWATFIDRLERKIKQLIDEPNQKCDHNQPQAPPPGLQDIAKEQLASKLCDENGNVKFETFWLQRYCDKFKANDESNKEKASFREWIYSVALTINKKEILQELWRKGLLTGICGRHRAFDLLSSNPDVGTMMFRFSDSLIGIFMITYYLPADRRAEAETNIPYIAFFSEKLERETLMDFLRDNSIIKLIDNIYPDIPKTKLFSNQPRCQQNLSIDLGYETIIAKTGFTLEPSTDSDDSQSVEDSDDFMEIDFDATAAAVQFFESTNFEDLIDGNFQPEQLLRENQFEELGLENALEECTYE